MSIKMMQISNVVCVDNYQKTILILMYIYIKYIQIMQISNVICVENYLNFFLIFIFTYNTIHNINYQTNFCIPGKLYIH